MSMFTYISWCWSWLKITQFSWLQYSKNPTKTRNLPIATSRFLWYLNHKEISPNALHDERYGDQKFQTLENDFQFVWRKIVEKKSPTSFLSFFFAEGISQQAVGIFLCAFYSKICLFLSSSLKQWKKHREIPISLCVIEKYTKFSPFR